MAKINYYLVSWVLAGGSMMTTAIYAKNEKKAIKNMLVWIEQHGRSGFGDKPIKQDIYIEKQLA